MLENLKKNCFDLAPFYERFEKYVPGKPLPDRDFLLWFLGFVEGDGTLAILGKNLTLGNQTLTLSITLHESDKHVLDLIVDHLGVGKVYKGGNNLYNYQLKNLTHIALIIELFNGNTVLTKFYKRFVHFLERYNQRVLNPYARKQTQALGSIELKPFSVNPTLDDAWFSGFTDAEGCFHENLSKQPLKKKLWAYYFAVYQSGEGSVQTLTHFKDLFACGSIQRPKRSDEIVFKVISASHNVDRMGSDFQKFTLKTKKNLTFKRWLNVMTVLKNHKYSRRDLQFIYDQITKKTEDFFLKNKKLN